MPRPRWDDDFEIGESSERYRFGGGRKAHTPRNDTDQAFKCGNCRQFIGAPLTGGLQRNHCPNCLYSRHVDGTRPGDRRSSCGALMEPVGVVTRRNGELVLIHRCRGCGKETPNRIAADDNPVLLDRLPQLASVGFEVLADDDDFRALLPEEYR